MASNFNSSSVFHLILNRRFFALSLTDSNNKLTKVEIQLHDTTVAKDAEIAKKVSEVADLKTILTKKKGLLEAEMIQRQDLQSQVKAFQEEVSTLAMTITRVSTELGRKDSEVTKLQTLLAQSEAREGTRATTIVALEKQLAARDSEIVELRSQILHLRKQSERESQRSRELSGKIEQKAEELSSLNQDLARSENSLDKKRKLHEYSIITVTERKLLFR